MASKITVVAPSSTANLGPGFDVFGLAINAFYDEVTLTKKKTKEVSIVTEDDIPTNPDKNTAGLVVKNMIKKFKTKMELKLKLKKMFLQDMEWEVVLLLQLLLQLHLINCTS